MKSSSHFLHGSNFHMQCLIFFWMYQGRHNSVPCYSQIFVSIREKYIRELIRGCEHYRLEKLGFP